MAVALSATQSKPERQPADPLTSHTCVHEARAYLANTGQDSAVVTRNGRPVGVITSEALSSLCPSNLPITRQWTT